MGSKKRPKQPIALASTAPVKRPAAGSRTDPNAKTPMSVGLDRGALMASRPVWKFEFADHDGPWCFDALSGPDLVSLLCKLRDFERMTIRELFYTGDEPGKQYDVPELPKAAQDRLVAIGREDETKLARLRTGARERLYGFVRGEVFHVLWWDPRHEVFPSRKRNT